MKLFLHLLMPNAKSKKLEHYNDACAVVSHTRSKVKKWETALAAEYLPLSLLCNRTKRFKARQGESKNAGR